jgi:hypothetical protein
MNPHCWHGHRDDLEPGTREYERSWAMYPDGATCMLPNGHAGPHEYTPDDEITVSFEGNP